VFVIRSDFLRRFMAVLLVTSVALVSILFLGSPGILNAQGTGLIRQWGQNDFGQSMPPSGNDFKAVSAGYHHSLAVLVGGTLVAWGDNSSGQTNVPTGSNFVAVAAGWKHSLALKADGTIAAWGDNTYGQATAPAGNDYVAIAAGQCHSIALHANGTLTAWGRNDYGQTTLPSPNSGFKAIAAGFNHNVALKVDGTLTAWGDNSAGQCTVIGSGYKAVSAGQLHTLALKMDGTLSAWGANDFGQRTVPTGGGFSQISSGAVHNLALKSNGTVVAWGDDSYGQLDVPPGTLFSAVAAGWYNSTALKPANTARVWGDTSGGQASVPNESDFVSMSAGDSFVAALKVNGSLAAWGQNGDGETNVPSGNNYVAVSAGGQHSLALKDDGSIIGWGSNSWGQTTIPSPNSGFIAVAAGDDFSVGLKSTGQLIGWGHNGSHQASPPSGNNFTSITGGWNHGLATKYDGTIVAWGDNSFGQGNVPSGTNYKQVAGGMCHSLALKTDGSIVGFGQNTSGQCTPTAPNSGYIQVAAGDYHSVGLRSDGSLAAWGTNNYYQTSFPPGNIYSAISARHNFSLALCPYCYVTASVLGGHGSVTPANQYLVQGQTATISIVPDTGYKIDSITDNGVAKTVTTSYVISNIREDHNVVVTFTPINHTVNASVSGSGGTVSPAQQSVADGGTAQVTITPSPTYKIATITDNSVSMPVASPYVIHSVTADHNVVVTFALDQKSVDASVSGSGGTVSPTHQNVTVGGSASINMTPGAHYHVSGITDNGTPQTIANPYVINNVQANHTVVVTFALDTFTVSASVSGAHGTVSPTSQSIAYGSNASIAITPDAHYHIATITDNSAPVTVANPYVINNVTAGHTVVVTFALDTYSVNASVSGTGGTVDPAQQSVAYGGTGTINLHPDAHYHVSGITDNGTSQTITSPYVISNVQANHTVVVTFALDTYTVSASVTGGHGSVDPTTQSVTYGGTASISIVPDADYHVDTITDNSLSKPIANPYVITNVAANHDVVVTFALNTYNVDASVSGVGGTVDPGHQVVPSGGTATVTITPDPNYHISGITDNNVSKPAASPCVIDNVKADHTVVVTFELDHFTVTASVSGGHGSVNPTSHSYPYGGSASVNITPDANYHIATISDNTVSMPVANPYVINNVTTSHDVVVTFALDTHTVNASVSGGGGTVDPPQQSVPYGGSATITITADATHRVDTITDNNVSKPPVSSYVIEDVTVDHDVVVTFADNTKLVTASVTGSGGTVNPAQQHTVIGQDATIHIIPDANHHISSIFDNGISQTIANPYVISNVQADHAVMVNFAIDRFDVDASIQGSVGGTVSPATQSIAYNGTAQIDIACYEGWHVGSITDNSVPVPDPLPTTYVINGVMENHAVVVTFARDELTVTASGGSGGTVDPASQIVEYDNPASITITADQTGLPPYHIASITDNGEYQPVTDPHEMVYTISNVHEGHAVEVTFGTDTFTVASTVPLGHGTADPTTQTVAYAGQASIALTPEEGYHILTIRDNGAAVAVQNPYLIDPVTSDHHVVVVFAMNRYTVTAGVDGEGGTVTPDSQRVTWHSSAQVDITPDDGYDIVSITDNGATQPIANPYVIGNIDANHDIRVAFGQHLNAVNASVSGGHGTVTPDSQQIVYGSPATINFNPATGYRLASITDNGSQKPLASPYVIASVTEQHDVVVTFEVNTYAVTASVSGSGGTVSPPSQNVNYGSTARVNVTAYEGHHVSSIKDNGSAVAISNPYNAVVNISNVRAAHNVVATFANNAPEVTLVSPASGDVGTEVTLTGECFGAQRGTSQVTFGGAAVAKYVSWADQKIVAEVPTAAVTGPVQVTTTMGGSNTDKTFTLVTPQWYLAEGSTAYGFDTYITIENPNTSQVTAVVEYMTASGRKTRPDITLPPTSQTVFDPRNDIGATDFSTKVSCKEGKTIAVDRRMLWQGPGAPSVEGHSSIGVSAPATSWYLPEGCSDYGFECWLLIQNPQSTAANCTITYMIEGGVPVMLHRTIPALSRMSYSMATDIGARNASILVQADVPVIPERSMYRNNRREGHDSIGTTTPAKSYYLAEGTTSWGFTTYVLVQNPNEQAASVKLTYMTDKGPVPQAPFTMPPQSRQTVRVNDAMPGKDFSTKVEADVPVIAERAMYWGSGTPLGEACHDSIGLAAPHDEFYLPDGETDQGYETYTLVGNPNASDVQVKISYLTPEGNHTLSFTATVPANSRATFNMADKVPSGRAAVMVETLTAGKKVLVERSMYWNSRGAGTNTIGCY
jgi:alpha-tubulin suppressor-like RCC1 family protein